MPLALRTLSTTVLVLAAFYLFAGIRGLRIDASDARIASLAALILSTTALVCVPLALRGSPTALRGLVWCLELSSYLHLCGLVFVAVLVHISRSSHPDITDIITPPALLSAVLLGSLAVASMFAARSFKRFLESTRNRPVAA